MLTDTTPSSTRSEAAGSGRRGRALGRTALSLAAIIVLSIGGVALGAVSASAAPAAPGATTSPPNVQAPVVAPTITVADSASSRGRASGTATAGHSLRVLDPVHPQSSLCTATVAGDGSWSCAVALTSGANQTLTLRDLSDTSLPDVTSAPFSVLTAPVIASPAGIAVGAKVTGTGYAGATVTLSIAGSGSTISQTASVSSSGAWQVLLPSAVPSGKYSISAVQRSSRVPAVGVSSASGPVAITVDRTAPAAPVITFPAAGSTVKTQPFTFRGTGETGAQVTTYIDSNPVCTATVVSGRWSCTTTGLEIPQGTRSVQAGQRDAAGNYGPASKAARVTFASTPSATPTTPQTPGQSTQPSPSTSPAPSPSPSASPSSPAPGGSSGSGGSGGASGPSGGPGGTGGGGSGSAGGSAGGGSGSVGGGGPASTGLQNSAASSWTAPTGFGHNLPTLSQSVSGPVWLWALVIGLIFVLLVIAPLRLAATALGGRLAIRARHFTGRNRTAAERDEKPLLPPAAALAAAVAAGAVLVALGFGVDDQVRYVRLLVAITIGIVVVNGLGMALPALVVGRRLGLRLRLRVTTRMLLAAAVACLATRILSLEPPLVLGVLVVAGLVDTEGATLDEVGDTRRGGILAAAQLGSLALVSFAAWAVHGLVPSAGSTFGLEVVREALATMALAGLGSLIVLLLPLGTLPGRALWTWSKSTLAGLGVVGAALAAVVYAGSPGEAFPVMPLVVAAVVFAVVALSAWVWVRWVEPAMNDLA